jgi:hypothetical protein
MDVKQMMNKNIWNASVKEWACRILLTCNVWLAVSGSVTFLQTEYQLVSPIIPLDTVLLITRPYIYASLVAGVILLISLWLYFLKKHLFVIIIQLAFVSVYSVGPPLLFCSIIQ